MKTAKELFHIYLTKNQYEKAYEYSCKEKIKEKYKDVTEALTECFNWRETDEGFDYWLNVNNSLIQLIESEEKQEIKKKLINIPMETFQRMREVSKRKEQNMNTMILKAIGQYLRKHE